MIFTTTCLPPHLVPAVTLGKKRGFHIMTQAQSFGATRLRIARGVVELPATVVISKHDMMLLRSERFRLVSHANVMHNIRRVRFVFDRCPWRFSHWMIARKHKNDQDLWQFAAHCFLMPPIATTHELPEINVWAARRGMKTLAGTLRSWSNARRRVFDPSRIVAVDEDDRLQQL